MLNYSFCTFVRRNGLYLSPEGASLLIPEENSHSVPLLRELSALPALQWLCARFLCSPAACQHRSLPEKLLGRFLLKEYSFSHSPTTGTFLPSTSTIPPSAPLCPCLPLHLPQPLSASTFLPVPTPLTPSPPHLLSCFLLPVSLFPVLLCSLFLALPWLSVPHQMGF